MTGGMVENQTWAVGEAARRNAELQTKAEASRTANLTGADQVVASREAEPPAAAKRSAEMKRDELHKALDVADAQHLVSAGARAEFTQYLDAPKAEKSRGADGAARAALAGYLLGQSRSGDGGNQDRTYERADRNLEAQRDAGNAWEASVARNNPGLER